MFAKTKRILKNLPYKFKGKKKFVSCPWLEYGLIFDHAKIIRVCCEQSHDGKGRFVIDDTFNGVWLDVEKIIKEKRRLRDIVRTGNIPDSCVGCIFLKNDYWEETDTFKNILLTHWTNCNARCRYCPAVRDKNLTNEQHYNIIPILEQMFSKKVIDKNAYFSIAGGESTIYPEFEKLLYYLIEQEIKNININTSGIVYAPAIYDAISKNLAEVVISLDCSDENTYREIKGVDTFNAVIGNIKRYVSAEQIGQKRVTVKFIILNGCNDNIKQILDWFILCKNLGVKKFAIDVDINWYNEQNGVLPYHIFDMICFAKTMAKKNFVSLDLYDRANMIYNSRKTDKKW